MAVDRAFSLVKGRVITGTLREGKFALDAPVFGFSQSSTTSLNLESKVFTVMAKNFQTVDGPARLAISFKGRDAKQIQRGDWLSTTPMVHSHAVLVLLSDWFPQADFPEGLSFTVVHLAWQVRAETRKLKPRGLQHPGI